MKMSYLREFEVLAKKKEFISAAEELSMGQASLSKHIRILEEELGIPLFKRTTRTVELSDYGKAILPYISEMLKVQEECIKTFEEKKESLNKHLNVGLIHGMGLFGITDILIRFKKEHPEITINLTQDDSFKLEDKIIRGECDIAFIKDSESEKEHRFERILFSEDVLTAVLPLSHPLASEKKINLKNLSGENFLLLPEGSFMYEMSVSLCKNAGFIPNIVFTGAGGGNIMQMVASGMGISLLMKKPAQAQQLPGTAIVEIVPEVKTEIDIIYEKERLNDAEKEFLKFCKNKK